MGLIDKKGRPFSFVEWGNALHAFEKQEGLMTTSGHMTAEGEKPWTDERHAEFSAFYDAWLASPKSSEQS